MRNCCTSCPSLSDIQFSQLAAVGRNAFDHAFANDWVPANDGTGDYALCANALTDVTFPSLEGAEAEAFNYAFENCSSLETASFPALGGIGERAFYGAFRACTNLKAVAFGSLRDIPGGSYTTNSVIYSLGGFMSAFHGCSSITNVAFPALLRVGPRGLEGAFVGCTELHELRFPELIAAGAGAFNWDRYSIDAIYLPKIDAYGLHARAFRHSMNIAEGWGLNHVFVRDLYIPRIKVAEAVSRDCFGLATGSVLHCKDGDATAPERPRE